MLTYKIEVAEAAERDLEAIGNYIAYDLKAFASAVSTVRGIQREIKKLRQNPNRHELDDDELLAGYGVRKQYYKNYKIYYQVDSSSRTVQIFRVLHMRVDSRAALYRTIF